MPTSQPKAASNPSLEHHLLAAECCNKAAREHSSAAKFCASGDIGQAELHARNAKAHCSKAQQHGEQAMTA